jgi:hypothetical protein
MINSLQKSTSLLLQSTIDTCELLVSFLVVDELLVLLDSSDTFVDSGLSMLLLFNLRSKEKYIASTN